MPDVVVTTAVEGANTSAGELRNLVATFDGLGGAARRADGQVGGFEAELRRQESTARRAQGANQQLGRGFEAAGRGANQASRRMANVINVTTETALGFGGLNNNVREFTTVMATAGNNAFLFANALGPVGTAVAVVATAIPGLIGLFGRLSTEMDEAETSTRNMTTALERFEATSRRIRQQRAAQERRRELLAGEADSADQQTRVEQANENIRLGERELRERQEAVEAINLQIGRAQARARRARDRGANAQLAAAESDLARLRDENEAASREVRFTEQRLVRARGGLREAEEALRTAQAREERQRVAAQPQGDPKATEEDPKAEEDRPSRARGSRRRQPREQSERARRREDSRAVTELLAPVFAEQDITREREQLAAEEERLEEESRRKREDAEKRSRERRLAAEQEYNQRLADLNAELVRNQIDAQFELAQQRAETLQGLVDEIGEMGIGFAQGIGSAFTGAFDAAIRGEQEFGKAFEAGSIKVLANLGDQLVARGFFHIFDGTALLFGPRAAEGGIKIGAGTAMVGLGIGLGAAASAAGAGGGGAGAGARAGAERPDSRDPTSDGEGGGDVTYIVDLRTPILTAGTETQFGERLGDALRDGERRRRRIPPRQR